MIAGPEQHYESETLRQLLDEDLPAEQSELVEAHVGHCESCRGELEQIAGGREWWDETAEVLSVSTVGPVERRFASSKMDDSLDASLEWIRPLLSSPLHDDEASHADEASHDDVSSGGIGRLDQYLVEGVIGQGGMGVVLSAVDKELNRPVAIKVLSPHLAGVGAARARFMREAQAAAAIVHPSVVPIYSIVPSARLPYIVMPRIQGGNLQQRINRDGPLELAEVLRIGMQVAEGLEAAHRQGVIHRDIKPANILIEEGNGRALISDFGLARALDDATLTMSGMIAGTPQYMSPEQASGEPIDARSDLFSLGSLLYALSSGRPPYRAESPLGVLRKITETRPKPIHQINEAIPIWFNTLVARLMHSDISARVGSATEVACLMRDAYAHVRNPSVHAVPSSLMNRRDQWLRRGVVLIAMASIVTSAGLCYRMFTAEASTMTSNEIVALGPPASDLVNQPDEVAAWYDVALENELHRMQMQFDEMTAAMQAELASSEENSLTESETQNPISAEHVQ